MAKDKDKAEDRPRRREATPPPAPRSEPEPVRFERQEKVSSEVSSRRERQDGS